MDKNIDMSCPLPASASVAAGARIQMAHGAGGRATQQLLDSLIRPAFNNAYLEQQQDGAILEASSQRLAFATDNFVVQPLFFPGGDIGKLAVLGTINDLAMCGATPWVLTCALIIEEGLPIATLQRVVQSMAQTATACAALIVCGDTKVVEKGKGDGLFINTTGIGRIADGVSSLPANITAGASILINGDVGRHGMAILAQREGLEFADPIVSDCQSLAGVVASLIGADVKLQCLRDLTRGGLATNLHELCSAAKVSMQIDEQRVPIDDSVRGACEIFGIDPLYVACEGRLVVIVPQQEEARALQVMRAHPTCPAPACIGRVVPAQPRPQLILTSTIGTQRLLEPGSGEPLPRIC